MGSRLRIVSYNVRYFGHALRGLASTRGPKRSIAAGLTALEPWPDVICLQEVETVSLRSSLMDRGRTPEETQLEAFMGRLEEAVAAKGRPFPYEAFYFRAHTYSFRNTPIYTTGLAVIVNKETVRIGLNNAESPRHITHHHVERWRDTKQSRICGHLRLADVGGRPLHVFNTHLSLPTPWAKEFWQTREKMGFGANQLQEARRLTGFIKELSDGEPFVVCGDFNSPPASPVYRYLTEEAGLIGAQERLGLIDAHLPRGFPTAGFMRLRMHLDHIFSGPGLRWTDMDETRAFGDRECAFFGYSDHVPLIGRFELQS